MYSIWKSQIWEFTDGDLAQVFCIYCTLAVFYEDLAASETVLKAEKFEHLNSQEKSTTNIVTQLIAILYYKTCNMCINILVLILSWIEFSMLAFQ